jgi:hypothetical protein
VTLNKVQDACTYMRTGQLIHGGQGLRTYSESGAKCLLLYACNKSRIDALRGCMAATVLAKEGRTSRRTHAETAVRTGVAMKSQRSIVRGGSCMAVHDEN